MCVCGFRYVPCRNGRYGSGWWFGFCYCRWCFATVTIETAVAEAVVAAAAATASSPPNRTSESSTSLSTSLLVVRTRPSTVDRRPSNTVAAAFARRTLTMTGKCFSSSIRLFACGRHTIVLVSRTTRRHNKAGRSLVWATWSVGVYYV